MKHTGTQTITTERLILRRFVADDAKYLFANWASDPDVTKFISWKAHENVGVSERLVGEWVESYKNDDYYHWIIVPNDVGEPIGAISAVQHDDRTEMVHIGYCIGKKWWHHGYTSEALEAVIRFFFTEVGVNRVEACHDSENTHSGDVMKKCSMVYEGTKRQGGYNNRGIVDLCMYSILRSEWEK